MTIQRKPKGYPKYKPSQHQWFHDKWEKQHRVPENATQHEYDDERRVLIVTVSTGEKVEIKTQTPPPWSTKRLKE